LRLASQRSRHCRKIAARRDTGLSVQATRIFARNWSTSVRNHPGLLVELLGRCQNLCGRGPGFGRSIVHASDAFRYGMCAARSLLRVLGYLASGSTLLLHRGSNVVRDLVHASDRGVNGRDRLERGCGCVLDGGNLRRKSSVALAVCVASDLTSLATTAKPFPASPARAAWMAALRASRLVREAISWMRVSTSPIFCAASSSP
jgi:hypothetical protein